MLNSSIKTLYLYIILVEKIIDFIEGKRRKQKVMSTPLGETLQKVEEAQNHLTDAIESIDIIKHQVTMEREALDSLLGEVSKKREQYNKATSDLELTQELLNTLIRTYFSKPPKSLGWTIVYNRVAITQRVQLSPTKTDEYSTS